MKAYEYEGTSRDNCKEIPIPEDLQAQAEEYREKLMDEVAEVSDELMERYLEGEEISHDETVGALKTGVTDGMIFPVTCGVATKNLAMNRLLDAIVEDLPSPEDRGAIEAGETDPRAGGVGRDRGLRVQDAGRSLRGPHQPLPRLPGRAQARLARAQPADRQQGADRPAARAPGQGAQSTPTSSDPGTSAPWPSSRRPTPATCWHRRRLDVKLSPAAAPGAGDGVRDRGEDGDEDKVFTSLRRLQEEDPTIDLHRDQQTGEQIVAGLSQIHVEVIVGRLKERFGAEVTLKPPRVPYQETIRSGAKAHGRYKKQTGGRGQFGDCHIEIEPTEQGEGFEFVNKIKGGVIPTGFIPAVEKGVREAMQHGTVAGCPVKDIRVTVFDGSYHSVDSSEMAFKIAGSMAFKEAMEKASPVLLEPIMAVAVTVPEESVGDVIGDLNGRRGRPLGMEPSGSMTEVKAEVPMSEMLSYAPDLRSITGGQGDYTMEFARYEEVPAHIAGKVVEKATAEHEAVA